MWDTSGEQANVSGPYLTLRAGRRTLPSLAVNSETLATELLVSNVLARTQIRRIREESATIITPLVSVERTTLKQKVTSATERV